MAYITEEMARAHNALYGNYVQAAKTCIVDEEVDPKFVTTNILWGEIQKAEQRDDYATYFSPILDENGLLDYYKHPEKILGATRCSSAWQRARLKANGDIAVGHICFPLTMGNIKNQSFKEIWNGTEFNKFRAFTAQGLTPACTRCCAV